MAYIRERIIEIIPIRQNDIGIGTTNLPPEKLIEPYLLGII
jgi:hypothetical protein